MGDAEGDEDDRPVHRVELDPFQIAIHTVTQAQYAEFVHATGYRFSGGRDTVRRWSVVAALKGLLEP